MRDTIGYYLQEKVEAIGIDYILGFLIFLIGGYLRLKYMFLENIPNNIFMGLLVFIGQVPAIISKIIRLYLMKRRIES